MKFYIIFALFLLCASQLIPQTNALFKFQRVAIQPVQKVALQPVALQKVTLGSLLIDKAARLQLAPLILRYVTNERPDLLPLLLRFAVQNPQLISRLGGMGRRKRDTYQIKPTKQEDEMVDAIFTYINENDSDDCVKQFACLIGYEQDMLDDYGQRIASFFSELKSRKLNSSYAYKQAFLLGQSGKEEDRCLIKFARCNEESIENVGSALEDIYEAAAIH